MSAPGAYAAAACRANADPDSSAATGPVLGGGSPEHTSVGSAEGRPLHPAFHPHTRWHSGRGHGGPPPHEASAGEGLSKNGVALRTAQAALHHSSTRPHDERLHRPDGSGRGGAGAAGVGARCCAGGRRPRARHRLIALRQRSQLLKRTDQPTLPKRLSPRTCRQDQEAGNGSQTLRNRHRSVTRR